MRIRRHQPISVYGVCGEPVSRYVAAGAREQGWLHSLIVFEADRPRRVAELRAYTHLAAMCHALVIFHAGELSGDLVRLAVDVCPWLMTPVRVVRIS